MNEDDTSTTSEPTPAEELTLDELETVLEQFDREDKATQDDSGN